MRRRRLAAAVLHLVLGGFLPLPDAIAAPSDVDDADDLVVEIVLAADDTDGQARGGPRRMVHGTHASWDTTSAAAALVAAGVELALVDTGPELPPAAAEALLRDAIAACHAAGTLKVVVTAPALDAGAIRAIAEPLGFQFVRLRHDNSIELYRDLYARRE